MELRGQISRTAFEAALTPAQVMTSQLVQGALMMGVVLFSLGVAFFHSQAPLVEPGEAETDTVRLLSFIHLGLLVVNVGVSHFLAQRVFSPEALNGVPGSKDVHALAEKAVMQQRSAMVIRMALIEGSAFFGLVICMLGVSNGVFRVAPEYWINLLSPFMLVAFGIATFPTKERLVSWFVERFLAS
jgi:F0F1-type ATP synthase membrane subunit c/vacuolar-type H+-ATPase subunit K